MTKIIAIAGNSASGKTTLSRIINHVLCEEKCTLLSGDDLHLWERGHEKWKEYTHLNPAANNLDLGFNHLQDLKNQKKITRSHYNHKTGKFDSPECVFPRDNIVYEGLHALYDYDTNLITDVKIFIKTPQDLIDEWKLKRDTLRRGYSREDVLKIMDARSQDKISYIDANLLMIGL
jgi:uridine kinase